MRYEYVDRFKRWIKADPVYGDKKIRYRFLWRPMIIGREKRWLEAALIEYEYTQYGVRDMFSLMAIDGWVAVRFVDSTGVKNV